MTRQIKLDVTNRARVLENDPILLPDTLTVEFVSEFYRTSELLITARNGLLKKKIKVHNREPLDLSELVREGVLEMFIQLIVKGTVVKSWTVDPIFFKSTEQGFELYDYIALLEDRIAVLEQKTTVTL